MTNREAMEIVLEAAEKRADYHPQSDKILEAIGQMQNYMNDLMREELGEKLDEELYNDLPRPSTGCDYGIGG